MTLSIIIPIYNEEETIAKVMRRMQEIFKGENYEIILVDDGSTDKTWDIVSDIQGNYLQKIQHPKNYGKGRAIRSGLEKATGKYVAIQDADLEYDPKDLLRLWQRISDPHPAFGTPLHSKDWRGVEGEGFNVIYGQRNGKGGYLLARLGNKILSLVCSILYRSKMSDIYTCYKIIPRELMTSLHLQSNGFEIEAEMTAKILKRKIKITEIPISYNPRSFDEGKHISWRDGYKGIMKLVKIYVEK